MLLLLVLIGVVGLLLGLKLFGSKSHYQKSKFGVVRYKVLFQFIYILHRVGQKTGPFLNIDNFAMVSGRKACDMSKVCKFCLEKIIKLA